MKLERPAESPCTVGVDALTWRPFTWREMSTVNREEQKHEGGWGLDESGSTPVPHSRLEDGDRDHRSYEGGSTGQHSTPVRKSCPS
jgi:hypothetical protein